MPNIAELATTIELPRRGAEFEQLARQSGWTVSVTTDWTEITVTAGRDFCDPFPADCPDYTQARTFFALTWRMVGLGRWRAGRQEGRVDGYRRWMTHDLAFRHVADHPVTETAAAVIASA